LLSEPDLTMEAHDYVGDERAQGFAPHGSDVHFDVYLRVRGGMTAPRQDMRVHAVGPALRAAAAGVGS
jgi:hypothetical protein